MKRGTARHIKLLNLASELKIETYAAVGLACCLWDWVGESCPNGSIGKTDDAIIAQIVGWRKSPAKLIDALVTVGLVDRHPVHRLIVHDWSTHSEDGVHTYLARRKLWFADGKAPRTRHLTSDERKEADAYYKNAMPPPQSKCGESVAEMQHSHSDDADGTVRSEAELLPPNPQRGSEGAAPRNTPADYSDQFREFCDAYPSNRREGLQRAFATWTRDGLDEEKRFRFVMKALAVYKESPRWKKDGGTYIEKMSSWLRNRKYRENPPTELNEETES